MEKTYLWLQLFALAALIQHFKVWSAEYRIEYLEDNCKASGHQFRMTGHGDDAALILKATSKSSYSSKKSCIASVGTRTPLKVAISFKKIDFRDCKSYIGLYGESKFKWCDADSAKVPYYSENNTQSPVAEVLLEYETSGESAEGHTGFELVATTYTDAPCDGPYHKFQCMNNHCIVEKYKCDLYNNCGDGTDEEGCPTETTPESGTEKIAISSFVALSFALLFLLNTTQL